MDEWCQPRIVSNALELLDKELKKNSKNIESVQLSFMTDPFMVGYPEVSELSVKILDRLNQDDIKGIILTKGEIPEEALRTSLINEFGITLVSLDEKFRKKYEQGTIAYAKRIASLYKAHKAGFRTWVSMEPYPTPNIVEQDLERILNEIKFVDKIIFGRMNYNREVSSYKNYKKFYNKVAEEVIAFCKENNIEYYIKNGTITK